MKTVLFITGFLFVLSSFAAGLEQSEVSGFSGSYNLDRGSAKASLWQLAGGQRYENITFDVFKENQQLRLVTPEEEILFDEVPDFILDLDQLSWTQAKVTTGGQEVSLSLDRLLGTGSGQSLDLQALNGQCRGQNLTGDFFQNLIAACTTSGKLSFSKLTTVETIRRNTTSLYMFFEAILNGLNPFKNTNSSVTLKNFDLKVNNKNFTLKVKANLSVSATIKANGSLDYSQDRVRIRLDKVKASFLTITGQVFDELEKIQSANIIVARPYVTILF